MALLPLETPAKYDLKVTAEVRFTAFANESLFSKACVEKAEKIGKCVLMPRVVTYDWDRARDVMRIAVEHRPDAA